MWSDEMYHRSRAARAMSAGQTRTIGVPSQLLFERLVCAFKPTDVCVRSTLRRSDVGYGRIIRYEFTLGCFRHISHSKFDRVL